MFRKFPSGPVVRTLRFHCRGPRLDAWSGDQNPTSPTVWLEEKKNNYLFMPFALLRCLCFHFMWTSSLWNKDIALFGIYTLPQTYVKGGKEKMITELRALKSNRGLSRLPISRFQSSLWHTAGFVRTTQWGHTRCQSAHWTLEAQRH